MLEEQDENEIDYKVKTVMDALRHGFDSLDSNGYRIDAATGLITGVWNYHVRTRELCFDEASRVVRRTADRMLTEESSIDKETIETLASAFISAIQKARSPIKRKSE